MTYAIVPINHLPLVRPVEEQNAERDAMTARMNRRKYLARHIIRALWASRKEWKNIAKKWRTLFLTARDKVNAQQKMMDEVLGKALTDLDDWKAMAEKWRGIAEAAQADRDYWKQLSESQTEAMGRMDRGTL